MDAGPSSRIAYELCPWANVAGKLLMERKLDEVVAALPEARRRQIEARAQDLVAELERLGDRLRDRADA